MKRLIWLLLFSSALAQGPTAQADYSAEGPPSPGTAQQVGTRYVDIRNAQLYVCTSTTYANKAYTCNWTNIGPIGQSIDASSYAGSNWLVKVNAAAAALTNGGTVVVPDSIAGDASSTTGSIPSNVTLKFPGTGTFTECTMNVGQFTKIYMDGAQLALNGTGCIGINLTTQALFQVNDKFILSGVRIDCTSKTNSTGIFLGANTAQVATYNVSVKNCTNTDVQFDGNQFSENYNMNVGNVTAGAGLIIHSTNPGGGGNSNTFYGFKSWSNAVGVLIYADTSIGQGANYFINPSILSSTTTGMCVFGNTFNTDVHWYGGAPEATGGGAATIAVNGKTCKQATIYANLADVELVDISIADATTNPWAIAENSSHFLFTNGGGYGLTTGVLVQADSTSTTSFDGPYVHLGQAQNVVAYPSTVRFESFGKMYGAPTLSYNANVPNAFTGNPQTPVFSDITGASSQSTASDPVYGLVSTVTYAASAGTKNTNRMIINPFIPNLGATSDILVSFLVQASANTVIACGDFNQNSSFQNVTLLAGQWTRVVFYEGAIASGQNVPLVCNATDSVGATVSFTGMEGIASASNTSTQQQAMNTVLVSGAVNPNNSYTLFPTILATNGTNQSSPILNINGYVWHGSASTISNWTIQDVIGAGTDGSETLTFGRSGSGTGFAQVKFPMQVGFGSSNQMTVSNVGAITTSGTSSFTGGLFSTPSYRTTTNCAVNSVSPAACGSAPSGGVVIPTTTTTYTVNTSAVTAASRVFLQPISFASNLPSSPTCVAPATTSVATVSAISAGASFTITLPSTSGQTCWWYDIRN